MKTTSGVVAIIPARGGSKGIPRKNVVDICGKPLIAYSIIVAKQARLIDRVIVSTEDEEIAEVAKKWGAEVPFLRPKNLADDKSDIGKAISFTLKELEKEKYFPEVVIQLYPTHPFRSANLVDTLTGKLIDGYNDVRTVKAVDVKRGNFFFKSNDRLMKPMIPIGVKNGETKKCFRPYGLYYGRNLSGSAQKAYYLHELKDPISLIDIDEFEDLRLAEYVISHNMFNFKVAR